MTGGLIYDKRLRINVGRRIKKMTRELVKRDIIWLSRQRDKTGWGMMEGWTKSN